MSHDLKNLPIVQSGLTDNSVVFGAKEGQSDSAPDPISAGALWLYTLGKVESDQEQLQQALGIQELAETAESSATSAAAAAESAAAAAASAVEVSGALPRVGRTVLKALDTSEITVAYLTDAGREGMFLWRTGDYSSEVSADAQEGIYIKADAVAASSGAWVRAFDGMLNVKWFGAKGDGTTDDTAVLNALKAVLPSTTVTFFFPPGDYKITDTVTFDTGKCGLVVATGARLVYSGTKDRSALVLGATGVGTSNLRFEGITVDDDGTNDWANDDYVGLRLIRTVACHIDIRRVNGFTVNVQLYGASGEGIAYNNIFLGSITSAKYHIDIVSTVANGFVNENKFYGGDIRNASAYNAALDSYGVRFRAESGAYTGHNQNVFFSPCLQLADGNPGVTRVPFLFDNAGTFNTVHSARIEGGRGEVVRVASDQVRVNNNYIDLSFVSGGNITALITETDGGKHHENYVTARGFGHSAPIVWDSGDLVPKAAGVAANRIAVKGCFFQGSGGTEEQYGGDARILDGYIRLRAGDGFAIGVWLDTDQYKRFELRVGSRSDRTGRIRFVAYDAAGNILDDSDEGHPHVVAGSGLAGQAAYGYNYQTQSDGRQRLAFSVGSNVARVKVLLSGGTAPLYLRSFQIRAIPTVVSGEGGPGLRVYSGLKEETAGHFILSVSPASGLRYGTMVAAGTIFLNGGATSGQPSYYQCTAGGIHAQDWQASTAYDQGEFVENDDGKVYVCVTAGTSAESGGPTGTGTGISDGTAVWDYTGESLPTFASGPTLS